MVKKSQILHCIILIIFGLFASSICTAVELEYSFSFGNFNIDDLDLYYPYKITITPKNQIIIIDKKPAIHYFDLQGKYLKSWRKNLPEGFNEREYITVNVDRNNNLYFTLEKEKKVLKYSEKNKLQEWSDPSFSWLEALYLTADDKFYLADNHKLMLINQDGEIEKSFTHLNLWQPQGLALNSSGNIYIADSNNRQVKVITPKGDLINKWNTSGDETPKSGNPCTAIQFDSLENLFILNTMFNENEFISYFKIYTKNGNFIKDINLTKINSYSEGYFPVDFVISDDKLYLLDLAEQCVKVYQINN